MSLFVKLKDEINFLKRHLLVLEMVKDNEPIGIMKTSKKTGLPFHQVRYSMRVLEHKDLIVPTKNGAKITKKGKKLFEKLDLEIKKLISEIEKIKF